MLSSGARQAQRAAAAASIVAWVAERALCCPPFALKPPSSAVHARVQAEYHALVLAWVAHAAVRYGGCKDAMQQRQEQDDGAHCV